MGHIRGVWRMEGCVWNEAKLRLEKSERPPTTPRPPPPPRSEETAPSPRGLFPLKTWLRGDDEVGRERG